MVDVDNLLTIEGVAARLHCKPGTVRAWLARGKLLRVKVGDRTLIERAEVQRFIERSMQAKKKRSE